jgi:hypothetical protein
LGTLSFALYARHIGWVTAEGVPDSSAQKRFRDESLRSERAIADSLTQAFVFLKLPLVFMIFSKFSIICSLGLIKNIAEQDLYGSLACFECG